jgi:hypothetical protein
MQSIAYKYRSRLSRLKNDLIAERNNRPSFMSDYELQIALNNIERVRELILDAHKRNNPET